MKIKIKTEEIELLSDAQKFQFPKYTTMLINQINQTAQGTRPKVVGKMSDLIQEFDGRTLDEWKEWYNCHFPNAIDAATDKIYDQFIKLKEAMLLIDKNLIREWVKDLVYTKTFCGLKFQQAIISCIANKLNRSWRLANSEEESRNIDGFIGDVPVQIKPSTYKMEKFLNENINVPIIYYEKKYDGLSVEYNENEIV